MEKRKLGRSNIEISPMGLGCWAIGGLASRDGEPIGWHGTDDAESMRALEKGFEMGVNFLDTADVYGCGHSEKLVGEFIKGKRDKVVVATKFGFPIDEVNRTTSGKKCDPDYIRSACDESLRRLQTDYIDLYQFHLGKNDQGESVRDTLEELVGTGKIRWYGWSTDVPDNARTFAKGPHCAAIQQGLSVLHGNAKTLKVCEDQNLASINRGPLSSGILTGKFTAESKIPEDDVRRKWDFKNGMPAQRMKMLESIRDILTSNGRSPAQGALAWIWARSPVTIPIPGFKSVAQVEENAGAMEKGPLSKDQMKRIWKILAKG